MDENFASVVLPSDAAGHLTVRRSDVGDAADEETSQVGAHKERSRNATLAATDQSDLRRPRSEPDLRVANTAASHDHLHRHRHLHAAIHPFRTDTEDLRTTQNLTTTTTTDLPSDSEIQQSKAGRVYPVDIFRNPRAVLKQLPEGVDEHRNSDNLLEYSYKRLGITKTVCKSSPDITFDEIVAKFKAMEATADGILNILNAAAGKMYERIIVFPIMVIDDTDFARLWTLVREDVQFLDPLIEHLSRTRPCLASELKEAFTSFKDVWGPLPQTIGEHQHQQCDAFYTQHRGIDRLSSHAFVTFLPGTSKLAKQMLGIHGSARISFITGLAMVRLVVLIEVPKDPLHSPNIMGEPGLKMPICVRSPETDRLAIVKQFSYLLNNADIFAENNNPSINTALWSMVRCGWETHLTHLSDEIEDIERTELDDPNVSSLRRINLQRRHVHQAARDIDGCSKALKAASDKTLEGVFQPLFHVLEVKAAALKQDVNDTTTLLIGAISVMDAGDSKIQARRSTALTALAAIYLPLSLATGVFGMNIWEINGGSPRWWTAVALGLGLLVLSFPFLAWIFIDRDRHAQTLKLSSPATQYDTSRLERGLSGASDTDQRSSKKKSS